MIKNRTLSDIPLFSCRVSAGFPSPADDYADLGLDLNTLLVTNPPATFFLRVSGDSMTGAGLFNNDLLVVDRSIKARDGHVVIAMLNGEFTVKRLKICDGEIFLVAENPQYRRITISKDSDFEIWGVVKASVHQL